MNKEETLLSKCQGIETKIEKKKFHNGTPYDYVTFHKLDEAFAVPDDVFIEIDATATAGTIGRLVDIDFGDDTYCRDDRIYVHDITFIIQVDGHKGTNRIVRYHATILKNHNGTTKYVRDIKKHKKEEIPPHVNKFKQTIQLGDWLVGLGPGKRIHFGEVTRYSKTSIWVNSTPTVKKSKENCITLPRESFVMPPGIEYEHIVTMMVLSGWKK